MKKLITSIVLTLTLTLTVLAADSRLAPLLERNWNIQCVNFPGYTNYQTQLQYIDSQIETLQGEMNTAHAELNAQSKSTGNRQYVFGDRYRVNPKEVKINNLVREKTVVIGRIEIMRLNWMRQNKPSHEAFLQKNPTFKVVSNN